MENIKNNSRAKAVSVYVIVSIFLFFEMAVQVSPGIMTNQLMQDLHINTYWLGLMSGFYFYTYSIMQIPSGLLFDRFKPKTIISLSILLCSIGSISFGLMNNFYLACFARLLMGFGSAFAFVSVLVVASDLFHEKHFALLAGITQALAALGAMSGQLPISYIVFHIGWHKTMIFLGFFGILLAILVWYLVNYEKSISVHKYQQHWIKTIIFDLNIIIKNKQTWLIGLYALLLWAPMSGFASLWGVPFLMHVYSFDLHTAAVMISVMWLGLAIGSPLLGILANKLNNIVFTLWFSALIGCISFLLILEFKLSISLLLIALFLSGLACAGQAISFAVVKNNNALSVKSTAIGFNNMAVVLSGALVQPLIGKLIAVFQDRNDQHAYILGGYVILIAYLLSAILAKFFIREHRAS